jgi:UDP-N-acetyl-D-glucosamine dehydrogenase
LTQSLSETIKRRKAKIVILGLGYVGLPLSVEFARAGFPVIGYDHDRQRVGLLERRRSYIDDIPDAAVAEVIEAGRFQPTTDPDAIAGCDVAIICVPTPFTKAKQPDLTYVLQAAGDVADRLAKGMLVILESTTYPGTTEEVVRPLLERSGLHAGRDFHLVFSPERVDPGNRKFTIANTPKIVGGTTGRATDLAVALYGSITPQVVRVSSPKAAEMAKLLENTFRHVNIALANEMAILCKALDIDIWEVIDAASTKPFGFMPFYPGPGVGGHCIPIDPFYFSYRVREVDHQARFIELAGEINASMPGRVVNLVADGLNEQGKSLRNARVLVLGVAYKPDVADTRESPALKVIEGLQKKGAEVRYHDPLIPAVSNGANELRSVPLSEEELRACDCAVILTAHSGVAYDQIAKHARLVVDTRNALKGIAAGNVVRL